MPLIETYDPGSDMKLVIDYLPETDKVTVRVSKGEIAEIEEFKPLYKPLFGLDVSDHAQALEIAEKLAQKIESRPL